jgi:hypothetical protein
MESEAQTVPVRIYQAENQIMLAAPMPGLNMPKAADDEGGTDANFKLNRIDATRGERISHRASDVQPS